MFQGKTNVTFLHLIHLELNPHSEEALRCNVFYFEDIFMLFFPKEKGQGLVEYAIILALVAIIVIAVLRLLGPKLGNTYSTIQNSLPG